MTVAYVGNKGTHTLADGDGNGTNPNESFVTLPGSYSVTGQTLNYDPAGLSAAVNGIPGWLPLASPAPSTCSATTVVR